MKRIIHSDAIVVGAGLSGLTTARALCKKNIPVRVLEANQQIADPWRNRHPQLRLNIHRHFANLPGLRSPRTDGAFLRRDTVVQHLQRYADDLQAPIDYGVDIQAVEQTPGGWRLETSSGDYTCGNLIFATGRDRDPWIPAWKGRDLFEGELIHAADLGDVSRFNGKRVLVVGAGNSGGDVLNHLARHEPAEVHISVRYGPAIVPARVFGFPLHRAANLFAALPMWLVDPAFRVTQRLFLGNLARYGLTSHPMGGGTRLAKEGVAFAIDDGFAAAIKSGRFKVVGGLHEFWTDRVSFDDFQTVQPDVVICATGYRTGLARLLGHLDVLDETGVPLQPMGETCPNAPSMWFTGYRPVFQGYFHTAAIAGERISKAIASEGIQHLHSSSPGRRFFAKKPNFRNSINRTGS